MDSQTPYLLVTLHRHRLPVHDRRLNAVHAVVVNTDVAGQLHGSVHLPFQAVQKELTLQIQ